MRRGHTLTELLVVLTILALFSMIVMPRFIEHGIRARLDAAADAVRADVTYSRQRALSTGLRHQLFLDTETREITVQPFRPETLELQDAGAQQTPAPVLRDRLHQDVRVLEWNVAPLGYESGNQVAGTEQPLTFYPEGRSDNATIVLEDSQGKQRGLRVDGFTGEIREMTEEELRQ